MEQFDTSGSPIGSIVNHPDCVLTQQAPGHGVNTLPASETAAEQVPDNGFHPKRVPVHVSHSEYLSNSTRS